jgi:hypothetical protein
MSPWNILRISGKDEATTTQLAASSNGNGLIKLLAFSPKLFTAKSYRLALNFNENFINRLCGHVA